MFLCHSVLPAPTLVGEKNVLFKKKQQQYSQKEK